MNQRRPGQRALDAVRRERASLTRATRQRGVPYADMPELAGNALAQAMLHEQRPLLDPQRRLAVLFSPKSACTSVVVWFFKLIGHAKAARDYDPWPHNYRIDVYYRSASYYRALLDDVSRYTVVRVVRNSYERVASSFRHALGTAYADRQIAEALAGRSVAGQGLSFAGFLDFLEREDLRSCNPHHRLQMHPLEELIRPQHTIDVSTDDLYARLNEIESALRVKTTDFPALAWLRELEAGRRVSRSGEFADAYHARLTREQALRGPWPSSALLLTPAACERIGRLYATDIQRYGHGAPAAGEGQKSKA